MCPRVTHSNYHSGETIAKKSTNAMVLRGLFLFEKKYKRTGSLTLTGFDPTAEGRVECYIIPAQEQCSGFSCYYTHCSSRELSNRSHGFARNLWDCLLQV